MKTEGERPVRQTKSGPKCRTTKEKKKKRLGDELNATLNCVANKTLSTIWQVSPCLPSRRQP